MILFGRIIGSGDGTRWRFEAVEYGVPDIAVDTIPYSGF
jgi:hypothetical protein